MKRKLPPDSEVAALHARGLTYREIAARFDCSIQPVAKAMDRWRDKPYSHQKQIKASTPDRDFVRVGTAPVEHRDTGKNVAGPAMSEGIYAAQYLDLHECNDLLREWGIE